MTDPVARLRLRQELAGPVLQVAPTLLGAVLRVGPVRLRVTEVEAYAGPRDPGSHAYRGPTPRTRVMFGPPGHAYVYFSYGMHHCLNVVCEPDGVAGAVLLRAGEVLTGEQVVRGRRDTGRSRPHPHRDLARGPGRLGAALGLSVRDSGLDLCAPASPLQLWTGAAVEPARVRTGPRVGVSGAGGDGTAYPWRWWLDGEASVSDYRPGRVPR